MFPVSGFDKSGEVTSRPNSSPVHSSQEASEQRGGRITGLIVLTIAVPAPSQYVHCDQAVAWLRRLYQRCLNGPITGQFSGLDHPPRQLGLSHGTLNSPAPGNSRKNRFGKELADHLLTLDALYDLKHYSLVNIQSPQHICGKNRCINS